MAPLPDTSIHNNILHFFTYEPFKEKWGRCLPTQSVFLSNDFYCSCDGSFSNCDLVFVWASAPSVISSLQFDQGCIRPSPSSSQSMLFVHVNFARDPSVVVIDRGSSFVLQEPSYHSMQYPIAERAIDHQIHLVHHQNEFSIIIDVRNCD